MKKVGLILFFIFVFAMCSGSEKGEDTNISGKDFENHDVVPDQVVNDEKGEQKNDIEKSDVSHSYVIEFVGIDNPVEVYPQLTYPITVRIYDSVSYKPLVGESVKFELTGEGDASIDSNEAVTNENGMAETTFNSGTQANKSYKLTVTSEVTSPITLSINVVETKKGVINLNLNWGFTPDAGEVVTIYIIHGNFICDQFIPSKKPPEDILVASDSFSATETMRKYELPQGMYYTIAGVVYKDSSKSSITGSGCIDNLSVYPDKTVDYEITFQLINMIFSGDYTFEVSFNGDEILNSEIYSLPAKLGEYLTPDENMKNFFKEELMKIFDDKTMGYMSDECKQKVEDNLNSAISEYLSPLVPPDFTGFESKAKSLLSSFYIKGKITTVKHLAEEGGDTYQTEFQASSIGFSGCSEDKCEFSVDELKELLFKINLDEKININIQVSNYDSVKLEDFSIPIDITRVAILIFNEYVLKSAFQTSNIYEFVVSYFKCSEFSEGFNEDSLTCLKMGKEDIEKYCKQVADSYLKPFKEWLNPLGSQEDLSFSDGKLTGKDNDSDIVVDEAGGSSSISQHGKSVSGTIKITH